MTRWNWTRWAAAILTGTVVAAGSAARAGETITLKFPGQPDRVVTVVKSTPKPDGSIETEVKDPKTGDTFTLIDRPPARKVPMPAAPVVKPQATPVAPAMPPIAKPLAAPVAPMAPPVAKPQVAPVLPPVAKPQAAPTVAKPTMQPPMATARDPILPRAKPRVEDPLMPPSFNPMADDAKRPGAIGRIASPKKAPPAAPAIATPAPISTEPPRLVAPKPIVPPAAPGRVEPVLPPTPAIPAPPTVPAPIPQRDVPQVSAPVTPAATLQPATAMFAMPDEVRPLAATLREGLAPSARMTAARALAEGRHGSTDQVKAILFECARVDPCPAVKACCIERLCKLGYYDPAFLVHLKAASDDSSDEVRMAARAALVKMTPR